MSKRNSNEIKCQNCGKENTVIMWSSLNGDLDPEAKQALINGTLFLFECKHCHHQANVVYAPILYHDMKHEAMVWFVSQDSIDEAQEAFQSIDGKGMGMQAYRKRIVTNPAALREKAIIFENGLDDRVIEIIKLIHLFRIWEDHPDAKIQEAFFMIRDEKYVLAFFGEKTMVAEFDQDLYDKVSKEHVEAFCDANGEAMLIDRRWAQARLGVAQPIYP